MAARPRARRCGVVGPDLGREGRHERARRPRRTLDQGRVAHLAEQIARSPAPAARGPGQLRGRRGRDRPARSARAGPTTCRQLQAAAAIGQSFLIRAYDECFRRHGRHAAQILLTHDDFDSRPRYLNVRNTLTALFDWDAVPVINENDTISVDEIKFGDNDRLAAMVDEPAASPVLVILSVVDGLYGHRPGFGRRRAS